MSDNFASLIDELVDLENKSIKSAMIYGGESAYDISPEMTGRFKGAWKIHFKGRRGRVSEIGRMPDFDGEINDFSIMTSKSIQLYNNSLNDQTNEEYSQFVRFDYTGSKANGLLDEIEQQIYSRMK